MPATSASLVRALQGILTRVPPELSTQERLSELRSRFTGSSAVCSLDALRTAGVPRELLALACTEDDLSGDFAGDFLPGCGCGLADFRELEDPDNRPYIWDQEDECP